MVKNLEAFRQQGSIKDLIPQEKEYYLTFLRYTYLDNIKASDFLLIKYPRWSIISSYYAMHDISKLFLAEKFNLKFSSPEIHVAVIQALRELVKRKDIINLIEEADKEYSEIISLHLALLQGKKERAKTQYYSNELTEPKATLQKASFFLDKIAKPYLKIVEELLR